MKRIVLVLALAACAKGPAVTGPASPELGRGLRAERPEAGCWAEAPAGWFETPCEEALTPEVIATLQRALAVRGHAPGAADGTMGDATRQAVLDWQSNYGLESGTLSLEGARALGVIATPM